jgi:GAF domain-containing protein
MSEIFESMHDLHFLRDSLEGADFVLELLHQKLPAKVTHIHLNDINTKEFVVVKARAPGGGVLGTRVREGMGLVGAAAKTGHGILIEDASTDDRWSRERYQAAGHTPKSLCVVALHRARRASVPSDACTPEFQALSNLQWLCHRWPLQGCPSLRARLSIPLSSRCASRQ